MPDDHAATVAMPPAPAAWCLADPDTLVHAFGDECVVYSPASGNTHLIGPSHRQVIELLRREPATTAAIVELLRGHLDLPPEEQLEPHVNLMLALLRNMDLIEPATS